jgi:hypothetical protein
MRAEVHFTPIVVSILVNHVQMLWLHFGTVRYGFWCSLLFNGLGARFVPVRFSRHRYGTLHPSIRGCTRTTHASPDPYRHPLTRIQTVTEDTATVGRVTVPTARSVLSRWGTGARQ